MDKEKKDKVKGICGTLLFHALLLFLLSLPFMSLSYEDPPTRKGGGSIAIILPPPPKEIPEEVPEESKDVITSDEGEIEVPDTKKVEVKTEKTTPTKKKKPPIPPKKLTDQEKAFDKNNNGKIDVEEQKKLNEFLEKIGNVGDGNDEEYNGGGEEGEGNGTGEGKGFGDGLDWDNNRGREGTDTLLCSQGKGTGYITVNTIIDAAGNIVEIDEESFFSKIVGIDNLTSSDAQIKKLLKCIKEEYKVTASTGKDKSNKLYFLRIDFTN